MDTKMMRAAALFLTGTVLGTIISFQEDVPSEPLGYRIPWRVLEDPAGRLIGGSGISAPWLMPTACLVAAALAGPDKEWPKKTVRTVASALMIGQLSEPVTWGLRSRKPFVLSMIAFNLFTTRALFLSVRGSK